MYIYRDPLWLNYCAKQERKAVRFSGNCIGGTLLIAFAASYLIQTILVAVLAATDTLYIINDPMFKIVLQLVFSALMFVPPFIILAKLTDFRLGDLFAHKKIEPSDGFWFVCFGMLVSLGANYIVNIWASVLESAGASTDYGSIDMPSSVGGLILWIFTMSLLPAFIEEFAFRVVILGSLRRFGDAFAIFASAMLFGLIHANAIQIPFAFILGLCFAYITVVSGSVIPAMIIHFLNNFNSCVVEAVGAHFGEGGEMLISLLIMIFYVITGSIAVFMLKNKNYFRKKLYKPHSVSSPGMTFAAFLSSPCIIIAASLFLLEALYLISL